jgi:hypothetical protein
MRHDKYAPRTKGADTVGCERGQVEEMMKNRVKNDRIERRICYRNGASRRMQEIDLAGNAQGFQILPADFQDTSREIATGQFILRAKKRSDRARDEARPATEIERS